MRDAFESGSDTIVQSVGIWLLAFGFGALISVATQYEWWRCGLAACGVFGLSRLIKKAQ